MSSDPDSEFYDWQNNGTGVELFGGCMVILMVFTGILWVGKAIWQLVSSLF